MKREITIQDKAVLAMKSAIRQVVEEHKKSGRPLAVWKNGKTVRISANKLQLLLNLRLDTSKEDIAVDRLIKLAKNTFSYRANQRK